MLEAAIFVIFPFCMVFAAISDMLSMTIANRVSLLLAGSFLVIAPLTGMDWSVYGMHIAAGALVLTVTFGLFAIDWRHKAPSQPPWPSPSRAVSVPAVVLYYCSLVFLTAANS